MCEKPSPSSGGSHYLWLEAPGRGDQRARHANERVLQFAAGREAFLDRVLIPMFSEFRGHAALFAWEISNEPEWAIKEFHRHRAARMHFADFRAFAREIASAVHEHAEVPVTLGSARLMRARAWMELGLDFYETHLLSGSGGGIDFSRECVGGRTARPASLAR